MSVTEVFVVVWLYVALVVFQIFGLRFSFLNFLCGVLRTGAEGDKNLFVVSLRSHRIVTWVLNHEKLQPGQYLS